MTDAVTFLKTRRSRPMKTLTTPVPDDPTLREMLEIAARTPDHGKLEPWRFIVLKERDLRQLAPIARGFAEKDGDADPDKAAFQFENGNLAVVVVAAPKPSAKVPQIEQTYSAGAVCLALVNAALASGWGASWISGWPSHQPAFCQAALSLGTEESIAGIIHIGTPRVIPTDRDRPDVSSITTWGLS